MARILRHEPFQLIFIIPFAELRKFTAHEGQLFAGHGHHMEHERAHAGEFVVVLSVHFVHKRLFPVYHLVVRDRQNILLPERVHEWKGQLVVLKLPRDRIGAYIIEHIVCKAHVPFEGEAETAVLHRLGQHGPIGGFLRDGQRIRDLVVDGGIELAEKGDRFEIPVVPLHVRDPFAGPFVIIEIEHGRYGIDPQSVRVVFPEPEERIGDEERLHLRSSDVKEARTPALVLHAVLALVFIARLSVEFIKSVTVLREMRRYPIEDDPDACTVHGVHEIFEILRCAIAGGGGVISADLIPPRAVKRMLHHREQLHVRITHFREIHRELVRDLPIAPVMRAVLGRCSVCGVPGA